MSIFLHRMHCIMNHCFNHGLIPSQLKNSFWDDTESRFSELHRSVSGIPASVAGLVRHHNSWYSSPCEDPQQRFYILRPSLSRFLKERPLAVDIDQCMSTRHNLFFVSGRKTNSNYHDMSFRQLSAGSLNAVTQFQYFNISAQSDFGQPLPHLSIPCLRFSNILMCFSVSFASSFRFECVPLNDDAQLSMF